MIRSTALAKVACLAVLCSCRTSRPSSKSNATPSARANLPVVALPSAAPALETAKVTAALPAESELVRAAQSCNAFGLALWAEARKSSASNLALSPVALFSGLSLLRLGAASSTEAELRRALRFDGSAESAFLGAANAATAPGASGEVSLRLVARSFGEESYPFDPQFLARSASLGAPLTLRDFKRAPESARQRINQWVSEQTQARVRDLLPAGSVVAATRLVLANALLFAARWAEPFDASQTAARPFHVTASDSRDTPTLHRQGQFGFAEIEGVKLLELPYRGAAYSMTVVLPKAGEAVASVETRLQGGGLEKWLARVAPNTVDVWLPKFRVETPSALGLPRSLAALGIESAFDARRADFSPMGRSPQPDDRLFVGDVFHRAVVTVDENGTEAVAASGVVMQAAGATLPAEKPREFHADRPFLFLIREKAHGAILFMGRVVEPGAR